MKKALLALFTGVCVLSAVEWQTEQVHNNPDSISGLPSIALDPEGNPGICYFEVETGTYEGVTLKATAKNSGIWKTDDVCRAGDMGYIPSITTDSKGNTYIAYDAYLEETYNYSVFLASDSSGEYVSKEIISGDGLCYEMPTVKIASDGKVQMAYLRWISDDIEEIYIYEVRYGYLDGESFISEMIDDSFLVLEQNGPPEGSSPIDFVLANDVPQVFYIDEGCNLCHAERVSADNWNVDTIQGQSLMLSSAVDAQGKLHLAYRRGESFDSIFYATNKTGSWQHEFVAKTQEPGIGGNFGVNCSISLDLDPQGNPHIVWCDYRPSDYFSDVYRSWKTPEGWSQEPVLSEPDLAEGNQFCRFFKIDKAGYGHITYMVSPDSDDIHVYYAKSKSPLSGTGVDEQLVKKSPSNIEVAGSNVHFSLSEPGLVTLGVYDASGRRVDNLVSGNYPAGEYAVPIQLAELSAGIYFVKAQSGEYTAGAKFIVTR